MRRALPLLAATILAGCSLAPKYVRPELPVPASWPVGDAYLRQITGLSGVGIGLMLCSLILKLADLDLLSAIPGTLGSICMFIGWRRNRASS